MNEDATFFDVNNYTNTHYTRTNTNAVTTENYLIKKFAVLKLHCVCDIACVN